MPRNTGGVYTLPAGNPVVGGTTISTTWANNTLNDIKTEMTNSLSRDGYGAMRAPLKLPEGSSTVPSLAFTDDPNTGLYLNGGGEMRVTATSTAVTSFTASEVRAFVPIAVETGGINVEADGISVAGGVVSTGATNGAGGSFTGGATNGVGLVAQGSGTGVGVYANGGGGTIAIPAEGTSAGGVFMSNQLTANGVFGWGTSTGSGVYGKGGSSGAGVFGIGTPGGKFANATASTASAPTVAAELTNGHLKFSATNPNTTVAFTNTITGLNTPKAWVAFGTGGASPVVADGFNIASVVYNANDARVTLAVAMANTGYAVMCQSDHMDGTPKPDAMLAVLNKTTTTFDIRATGGTGLLPMFGTTMNLSVVVFGRQ